MFVPLNCIVIDGASETRQEMVNFLAGRGVTVLAQAADLEMLEPLLDRPDLPQLVMVNLDPDPHVALQRLAPAVRKHSAISFFVLSQVLEADLLMEAMHVGVREFIPLPIHEAKFVAGIERVAQASGVSQRARFIQVIPTIGGCGSTTVACNVAVAMARQGKAAVLDMDLVRGSVATSLDLRPRYTIADLMDLTQRLDGQVLESALTTHADSGLAVLGRPDHPEDARQVTRAGLLRLLGVLGGMYDYVVADSMMGVDELYTTMTEASDLNVLVMQLTVPSVKNAERFLSALRRMDIELSRVRLVVNRMVRKPEIEPEVVQRTLGLKIAWTIPNDFRSAMDAINYGEPVVLRSPRAALSGSLSGLAGLLNGKPAQGGVSSPP